MPPLRLLGERQLLRTVTLINGKDTERHEPFNPFFDSPYFHLRSELFATSPGGSNRRFPGRQNAWGKPSSCALRPCPRRAHPGTDERWCATADFIPNFDFMGRLAHEAEPHGDTDRRYRHRAEEPAQNLTY